MTKKDEFECKAHELGEAVWGVAWRMEVQEQIKYKSPFHQQCAYRLGSCAETCYTMQQVMKEIDVDLKGFMIAIGLTSEEFSTSQGVSDCRTFIQEHLDLSILSTLPENRGLKTSDLLKKSEEPEDDCF